jgi:hypothetical protein
MDWERKCEMARADYSREVKEFYSQYPHFKEFVSKSRRVSTFPKLRARGSNQPKQKPVIVKLSIKTLNEMYADAPTIPLTPQHVSYKLYLFDIYHFFFEMRFPGLRHRVVCG